MQIYESMKDRKADQKIYKGTMEDSSDYFVSVATTVLMSLSGVQASQCFILWPC